jgi:hypothetical protein
MVALRDAWVFYNAGTLAFLSRYLDLWLKYSGPKCCSIKSNPD